eukprot:TRINITY_DN21698_c0_g1_i1.p1 TRINITY_DN21698_c0_g1~~TRINITY_DN21698_c0_g1_i1.p1  ORF type:complete len:464 (-),score=80.03 TRINITY_DN21698_c0_g1_i1:38-1318(-)
MSSNVVRCVWLNGIVVKRLGHQISLQLQDGNQLFVAYRRDRGGKQNVSQDLKLLLDIIRAVENLIKEWYEQPASVEVDCSHCLACGFHPPSSFTLTDCQNAVFTQKDKMFCTHTQLGGKRLPVDLKDLVPDVIASWKRVTVIPNSDIVLGKEIGEGGFAKVFKATLNGKVVAVKQLNVDDAEEAANGALADPEDTGDMINVLSDFRQEVWVMSCVPRHENIMALEGICLDPLGMVIEYISGGSLDTLVNDPKFPWTWQLRVSVALSIAKGMHFLHAVVKPPLIHRDLKSANVLIEWKDQDKGELICKIADFGSTVAMSHLKKRVVDNPVWLAPEVIRGEPYNNKVDVYSFGVIMWELISKGEKFFGHVSWWYKIEDMVQSGERPPIPESCMPEYKALLERCWQNDPQKRPEFSDIVQALMLLKEQC